MTKQTQTADSDQDKKHKPRVEPVGQQSTCESAPPGLLSINPQVAAASGSVQAQAVRLSDPRFQTAQRQAMATQLGRVGGNQHLQRVVAQMKQAEQGINAAKLKPQPAARPTPQQLIQAKLPANTSEIPSAYSINQNPILPVQHSADYKSSQSPLPGLRSLQSIVLPKAASAEALTIQRCSCGGKCAACQEALDPEKVVQRFWDDEEDGEAWVDVVGDAVGTTATDRFGKVSETRGEAIHIITQREKPTQETKSASSTKLDITGATVQRSAEDYEDYFESWTEPAGDTTSAEADSGGDGPGTIEGPQPPPAKDPYQHPSYCTASPEPGEPSAKLFFRVEEDDLDYLDDKVLDCLIEEHGKNILRDKVSMRIRGSADPRRGIYDEQYNEDLARRRAQKTAARLRQKFLLRYGRAPQIKIESGGEDQSEAYPDREGLARGRRADIFLDPVTPLFDSKGDIEPGDDIEYIPLTTEDCPPDVILIIDESIKHAITMLKYTIAKLEEDPVSDEVQKHFANHFGDYSGWRNDVVRGILEEDVWHFRSGDIDYECEEDCSDAPGSAGYVLAPRVGSIHLCLPWLRETEDKSERGEIFIHELHHWAYGQIHPGGYHENNQDNETSWPVAANNPDAFSEFVYDVYQNK